MKFLLRIVLSGLVAAVLTAVTHGDSAKFDTLFIIGLISWVLIDTEELRKQQK